MPGLYVKLDAEYASDDKLIEAGPLAELLYIRSLAFAKRSMKDGRIKRAQLGTVGVNIPQVARHAQALVDVGAWTVTAEGWQITNWLKRNKPAATIIAEENARKAQSQLMNHNKWHVNEGKPSPTCPLCDPDWEQRYSHKGSVQGSVQGSLSTKEETETETETEEEEEAKEEAKEDLSSSSVKLTVVRADPPTDDDQFRTAIDLVVAAKRIRYEPHDPGPWLARVIASTPSEHGATIRAGLAQGRSPLEVAGELVGGVYARQAARKIGVPIPDEEAVS